MILQQDNKYYLEIPKEVHDKIQRMNELGIDFPMEMFDVLDIFIMGAEKHGANSFLEPGVFTAKRVNSIFRHNLKKLDYRYYLDDNMDITLKQMMYNIDHYEEYNGHIPSYSRLDDESGLSHDLHSMCNSLMFYIKDKRGIK